uniref:Uncharacterized protein n=1 Tax=Mesocestoides corti TaxID=53468 RepID=A0A5K3EVY1_MESCO
MSLSCKSKRAQSLVSYSHGPLSSRCGVRGVSNWISYQHWKTTTVQGTKPEAEDSFTHKGEAVWCGVGLGRKHVEPHGLSQTCLSAFQWHSRKISSLPVKDTTEEQYIMSGVTSVADSNGIRTTASEEALATQRRRLEQ